MPRFVLYMDYKDGMTNAKDKITATNNPGPRPKDMKRIKIEFDFPKLTPQMTSQLLKATTVNAAEDREMQLQGRL